MAKVHQVFQPMKKQDRITSINLFPDLIAVHFAREERAQGFATVKTDYWKLAHPSQVPQLRIHWTTGVTRLCVLRPAALLVPLATGKNVALEPYAKNNSQSLDEAGLHQVSVSVTVPGLGYYSLDYILGKTCGDIELFGPDVPNHFGGDGAQTTDTWANVAEAYYYGSIQIAAKYGPVETVQ